MEKGKPWDPTLLEILDWETHKDALNYFGYSSKARMLTQDLTDIANLENGFRLNMPGEQNGQFEVRLPPELSIDELLPRHWPLQQEKNQPDCASVRRFNSEFD